jgi:hypothetical protein
MNVVHLNAPAPAEDGHDASPGVVIGTGEPPLLPRSSTKGLSPSRARFASYLEWRKSVDADIEKLEQARAQLESDLAKAEEIKAEVDGLIDDGVKTMLERIKSGLSWRLPIAPPPVAAADTRVARAAIDKVEGDLAAQCELRAALESRWAEFSGAAIREYGKELAAAYGVTLVTLRNQMCQLEALDLATGGGRSARLMAEVPGFTIAGHKHAQIPVSPRREDIANAVRQWQGLARAWSRDVHAPAERVLNFEPAKEPDVNEVVYERKTALERQIVDLERKI